jgi:hypothetical protein
MTALGARYAKKKWFPSNNVIYIPHSHCNNENAVRPDREVKAILYNGSLQGFPEKPWAEFKQKAEALGFIIKRDQTVDNKKSNSVRQDCCDLYLSCDIQVSFRSSTIFENLPLVMKGPTKLNNAGSFCIPSVAYPEIAFTDNHGKPGQFLLATNIDEMIGWCSRLKFDSELYNSIAQNAYEDAQPYHIDEVVKYYKELL